MRNEWWRKPNCILQISPTATDEELNRHARAFLVFARCGFTHLLFSQIETTLRAFLRALAPRAVNGGSGEFKNIYECLLRTHLEISADAVESPLTRLDFFRTIRNLIHNNGLYRSKQGARRGDLVLRNDLSFRAQSARTDRRLANSHRLGRSIALRYEMDRSASSFG
jgi:hypothetical protein